MNQYKTIDEVIRKGQLMINVPISIIMVVTPVLSTIGLPIIVPNEYRGISMIVGLIGGMGLGFVLGWTWWSFRISKWRIWAFENTDKSDWYDLKQRAIRGKLIWEDGNKFEKTEIRSNEEKQKIEKINLEIEHLTKDESLESIVDDRRIPKRTEYHFKTSETILSLIVPLIFIAMGVFLATSNNFIIGLISIGVGIYRTDLNKIKNISTNEVQLSISEEGIEVKKLNQIGFVTWNSTEDIMVDTENGILSFRAWQKEDFYEVTLNLTDYDIQDYSEFLRTINVYLKRNLNRNDS